MLVVFTMSFVLSCNVNNNDESSLPKKKKKTLAEKAEDTEARWLHEFDMQKNPKTGLIPEMEKNKELETAFIERQKNASKKSAAYDFVSRGPSNLGGRTRALKIDISDATGNTMLAGGVSSGVFRTTNGGNTWTKVSGLNDIHNVTAIAQDPRDGFQNIWYYGTGELRGNSAGLQESFLGNGIWRSTDSGLTWQQLATTSSGTFQIFDNFFDYVIDLEVHPTTGELFVGTAGKVYRMTEAGPVVELELADNNRGWTDVVITSTGRVYASLDGGGTFNRGVYTSATGNGNWLQINPTSADFTPSNRITMAIAPSNEDILYILYNNGESNREGNRVPEADLWQYNAATTTWTDYSSKLPDDPSGDSDGNDPFSIQGAYDLVISVKPDNENFVTIGGTNVYKISDITTDATFTRIGGYRGAGTYALYNEGDVNHHPDIHALTWSITDSNVFFTGTDGGVHKTNNINSNFVQWENLNNNYLTYQYYHVNMVNEAGNDFIIGGAQDNGTTIGGLEAGNTDASSMSDLFGGDGAAVSVTPQTGFLAEGYTTYVTTQNGSMYRGTATNITANITPTTGGEPYPSQFVTYFHMDPDNPATIYYASNGSVVRTNDAPNVTSTDWTLLGSTQFSERITTFETTRGTYDPENSYLFIGGRGGNIFRLQDPINATDLTSLVKITPDEVVIDPVETNNGQYTSDIAVHPTNPDIVMVTYASYGDDIRNIFITNNATAATPTWTEVERNLEAFSVRAGAIASVNGVTTYFVGTARGLYSSDDPTTENWELQGASVMGIPVVSGLVYRPSDNILLMGTHGNGIYQADLNSPLSVANNSVDDITLAMYPNPTQFKLQFGSNDIQLSNETKFAIYDIRGKEVLKGVLDQKSIDVSILDKGVYIVKLNQDNRAISRKFVKN